MSIDCLPAVDPKRATMHYQFSDGRIEEIDDEIDSLKKQLPNFKFHDVHNVTNADIAKLKLLLTTLSDINARAMDRNAFLQTQLICMLYMPQVEFNKAAK